MKQKIFELIKDKLVKKILIIFLAILMLYLIIFIWKWRQLPNELPLFYSLPKGKEQLGTPYLLLILPFFSFFFFVLDFIIASLLYSKEKLASYILITVGCFVSVLLFIAFIKIIWLIT